MIRLIAVPIGLTLGIIAAYKIPLLILAVIVCVAIVAWGFMKGLKLL